MQYLHTNTINTREDLDAIEGSAEWLEFMTKLKGSLQRKQDVQVYPDGYNQPDYNGLKLDPIWDYVEDVSTIERFGFTKEDFQ
jgi:hypothetical protein